MSVASPPAIERHSRSPRSAPLSGKSLRYANLVDELAALHKRHSGDVAAFRRAAIATLRAALPRGRDEARKALEAGGTGRACAETLSAQVDDLLQVALDVAARWLAPAHGAALPTVVAVGGY